MPTASITSPARLAWAQFRRHRLALLGLWLVTAMSAAVVLVPMLHPLSPHETRPWLGARPPLFQHPNCAGENRFEVGKPPLTVAAAANAAELLYHVRQVDTTTYRVTIRRGLVHSIQEGAAAVAELDLTTLETDAYELDASGRAGRTLPRVRLITGQAPPPGFLAPGQRVVILQWSRGGDINTVRVVLRNGLVSELRRQRLGPAAAAAELPTQVTLRGEDIVRVLRDGRPLAVRHWFGTDQLGRDLLVRVFYGGRISLLIGGVATLVSLVVGLIYGAVSGYLGGRVDRLMMGLVDILYALPFTFLVIILMVSFGRSLLLLFIAMGAVQWLTMARIVRTQIMSLKAMEFVEAARLSGASTLSIIFRQLVPHTLGPVIVYTTLTVPAVIIGESFLAFIGLQVQYRGTALDSWGALINQGVQALGQNGQMSWLLLFPALVMVLTLFALNCLGDGLRDCFDPKRSRRR